MGLDHTTNLRVELTKFRSIGLTPGQLDDCLCKTTASTFPLNRH